MWKCREKIQIIYIIINSQTSHSGGSVVSFLSKKVNVPFKVTKKWHFDGLLCFVSTWCWNKMHTRVVKTLKMFLFLSHKFQTLFKMNRFLPVGHSSYFHCDSITSEIWYVFNTGTRRSNHRILGSISKTRLCNWESNLIPYFVSHQTTAWLQRRLGRAAVLSLDGITMLPPRSVSSSPGGAAGRILTTTSPRMNASVPAMSQVSVLLYLNWYGVVFCLFLWLCCWCFKLWPFLIRRIYVTKCLGVSFILYFFYPGGLFYLFLSLRFFT